MPALHRAPSSPIAPAASWAAGAILLRGRQHASATLVAGPTRAPLGAAAEGGA